MADRIISVSEIKNQVTGICNKRIFLYSVDSAPILLTTHLEVEVKFESAPDILTDGSTATANAIFTTRKKGLYDAANLAFPVTANPTPVGPVVL